MNEKHASVLIIDPHASFRSASRALLEAEGFEVVAELERWADAEEVASALCPDVVLVDVSPWQTEGLEVARRLSLGPNPPAIVLMSSSPSDAILAASAGAELFVDKAGITADAIAEAALSSYGRGWERRAAARPAAWDRPAATAHP